MSIKDIDPLAAICQTCNRNQWCSKTGGSRLGGRLCFAELLEGFVHEIKEGKNC